MNEFQPQLNDREQEVRNRFAIEYVQCRDPIRAALRIGYNESVAREYAVRFMQEAYTLKAIDAAERSLNPDEIDDGLNYEQRKIKKLLFLEAEERGEGSAHSARVSALSKLVSVCGMESPIKVESNVNHSGNLNHSFDFSTLRKDELAMVRSLLEGRLSNDLESTGA